MGKSKGKRKAVEIDEEDLNRFAGSSEEEEEEEEELEEEEEAVSYTHLTLPTIYSV